MTRQSRQKGIFYETQRPAYYISSSSAFFCSSLFLAVFRASPGISCDLSALSDSEKTAPILLWMDNWYSGFSGQSAVLYTYMTLIFREMNYIYLRKTETKRFCRKRGHFFRMNDLKYPDNYLSDKIIFPLLVTTAW